TRSAKCDPHHAPTRPALPRGEGTVRGLRFPSRDDSGRSRMRIVPEIVRGMLPLRQSRVSKGVARFMFLSLEAQEAMHGIPCIQASRRNAYSPAGRQIFRRIRDVAL